MPMKRHTPPQHPSRENVAPNVGGGRGHSCAETDCLGQLELLTSSRRTRGYTGREISADEIEEKFISTDDLSLTVETARRSLI